MHDSFTPLAGSCVVQHAARLHLARRRWRWPLWLLVLAVVAVFVAGLMVGRTPEYLGKKIETREMKLAIAAVLIYPVTVPRLLRASVMVEIRAR